MPTTTCKPLNPKFKSTLSQTFSREMYLVTEPTHPLTHARTHSLAFKVTQRTHPTTHLLVRSRTQARTHSLACSRTHSLTHALTRSPTHALTHARTQSLTHSVTHSIIPITHPPIQRFIDSVAHCVPALSSSKPSWSVRTCSTKTDLR